MTAPPQPVLPPLVCPACRISLDAEEGGHACPGCARRYPTVAGIPDLRLAPDRYLTLEADREKGRHLAAQGGASFAEALRAYWALTPEVPAALAERYVAAALDGTRRAGAYLDRDGIECRGRLLLDVGCGTGGMLAAAAARGAVVVGADVALRWLVVARRHLEEAGVGALLVAADGARLPFPAGSFDVSTCVESLEHTGDQRGLLHSCLEAARPGGSCLVVTANRFSLAPDPTLRLWGAGFLPRRFLPAYVRWRRHTRAQFYRPLSASELRAMVGPRPGVRVGPARLPAAPPTAGAARRAGETAYERLRGVEALRPALSLVAPLLEVRR